MNWYNHLTKFADIKDFLLKQGIPAEIIDWAKSIALQIEPSGKYTQWIARQWKYDNVRPKEDDEKIINNLQLFIKLSQINKLPPQDEKKDREGNVITDKQGNPKYVNRNDINSFRTLGELTKFLEPYTGETVESKRQKLKRLEVEGAQPVYKQDNVEVIQIDTQEAASKLCRHTEWCIKDPEFFNQYGPPFYLFYVNNQAYALLHIPQKQLRDVYDEEFTESGLLPIFEATKYILKKDGREYAIGGDLAVFQRLREETEEADVDIESGMHAELSKKFTKKPYLYDFIKKENLTEDVKNLFIHSAMIGIQDYITNIKEYREVYQDDASHEAMDLIRYLSGINNKEFFQLLSYPQLKNIINVVLPSYAGKDVWTNLPQDAKDVIGEENAAKIFLEHITTSESSQKMDLLYDNLPESLIQYVPEEQINNLIEYSIENTKMDFDTWALLSPDMKNKISEDNKYKVADHFANRLIEKNYHTTGMSPQFPEDLVPYTSREKMVAAWSKMARQLPDDYLAKIEKGEIPYGLEKDVPIQSVIDGYYAIMQHHPFQVYIDLPSNLKQFFPDEKMKPLIYGAFMKNPMSFKQNIDLAEEFLTQEEILGIFESFIKRVIEGGGEPDIARYLSTIPEKYREQVRHLVSTTGYPSAVQQPQPSVAQGKSWYKIAQIEDKYFALIQEFINENKDIGYDKVVHDKNSAAGACANVSRDLVIFLIRKGIDAKVMGCTGFIPELPEDAHPEWRVFVGGDYENQKYLWHAVVKTEDAIIDLTGGQYGKVFSGIQIKPINDYLQNWESHKVHERAPI